MPITYREMHLRDYFKVLRKRRRLLAGFFLVTFGLIALYTFTTRPQYEGTTKVMLQKVESNELTPATRGVARPANDPGFYETQLQLIKSRAVALRVVRMLHLEDKYEAAMGGGGGFAPITWFKKGVSAFAGLFSKDEEAGSEKANAREIRIAEDLSRRIQVRPIPETRLVTISYLSPNPEFSAQLANTAARAYIEETLEMKMDSTRRTMEWMTAKAETERTKLEKSEQALQDYMRANNIVTLENKVAGTPEELSGVSTELVRAESHRRQLEALNSQVRQVMGGRQSAETISIVASDPSLQALRTQIVTAEKSVMELSSKYGEKHPIMEKAVSDLRILNRKKEQEIQRIVQSIRNEYNLALATEGNLRGQLNRAKGEALRLNDRFIQYGALKREVDTNRQLYDALLLKIKEQSITEQTHPIDLWIVEEAKIPTIPARPIKSLNLLLGLAIGLLGGVALAFFAEYLDNTVKNPEEAETLLHAPVLGVISKGGGRVMEEVVLKEPLSPIAENYKGLRTSLLLSAADAPPRRLLVTSSISGEGKTTTSVNLATSMAQSDKKVVIIDADLRKPRLHRLFKLGNKEGLSTYLAGGPQGELLKGGPHPNLTVITSGPIPPNPSELLMSTRMQTLIESLSERFDIIICDSPPVLAVEDPRILSRLFDGTIMVVQAHKTPADIALRAVKTMKDTRKPLLGLVVNGLDLRKSDYHYYYYQSYQEQPGTAGT